MELIGRTFFQDNRVNKVVPMLVARLQTGIIAFNLKSMLEYDLKQWRHFIFIQYEEDPGMVYIAPTLDNQDGFKLTTYRNNTLKQNLYGQLCSRHVAKFLGNVYKIPRRLNNIEFYMNKTDRTHGTFPVWALVLYPTSKVRMSKEKKEDRTANILKRPVKKNTVKTTDT